MRSSLAPAFLVLLVGAAPAQEPFRFGVVCHTRGGPYNGDIPRARMDELISELAELELDFLVLTGDLVYGDFNTFYEPDGVVDGAAIRADWDTVDALFARLGIPVHRAPGNHDVWDEVTRDIWLERYGALHQSFVYGNSRFLLLNSCWYPPLGTTGRSPEWFIRGVQLEDDQVEFVRAEMEAAQDAAHVFAFLGHMLWWDADADWWSDVHPLLAAGPTRAVFAGDLGPWKFSHVARDGVDYVQSTVEFTEVPLQMLRNREGSRLLSSQLDNYVVVTVTGPDVDYEVRTLGALTTGRFEPADWQAVAEHDEGTFRRRLADKWHTPEKLLRGALLVGALGFAGGVVVALGAGLLRSTARGRRT
jgi:3',5'-cyclic AMP phosphodiesterase CpdA